MAISELRKALTTGNGGGANLVAEDLERIIRSNLFLTSPLLAQTPTVQAAGSVHTFVKRTSNTAAWVAGEMSPASYSQSVYARRSVTEKILRSEGQISNFLQSAAISFVDSMEAEVESATQGMREAIERTKNLLPC